MESRDFRAERSLISTTRASKPAAFTCSTQPEQQPQFGSLLTTIVDAACTPGGARTPAAANPPRSDLRVIANISVAPLFLRILPIRPTYNSHQLLDLAALISLIARGD